MRTLGTRGARKGRSRTQGKIYLRSNSFTGDSTGPLSGTYLVSTADKFYRLHAEQRRSRSWKIGRTDHLRKMACCIYVVAADERSSDELCRSTLKKGPCDGMSSRKSEGGNRVALEALPKKKRGRDFGLTSPSTPSLYNNWFSSLIILRSYRIWPDCSGILALASAWLTRAVSSVRSSIWVLGMDTDAIQVHTWEYNSAAIGTEISRLSTL